MNIKLETTLERDIDLLILEEFISNPLFAKIFLDAVGIKDEYHILEAIHSKTDAQFGESDIVFILSINGNRHALHIEDKIDAMAQENQSERYYSRAQKEVASGEYEEYSVLIVAPEKYLQSNAEARKYNCQVTYEQLKDFFDNHNDARSAYKAALIDNAISEQKNGYQYKADPRMVDFCKKMNAYHKIKYPSLPDGSIAWWRYYPTVLSDATLVFKANKGHCDLQFSNTTTDKLFPRVSNFLTERMHVVKAGKSASIRIKTDPVKYENCFDHEIPNIDKALNALYELFSLSKLIAEKEAN